MGRPSDIDRPIQNKTHIFNSSSSQPTWRDTVTAWLDAPLPTISSTNFTDLRDSSAPPTSLPLPGSTRQRDPLLPTSTNPRPRALKRKMPTNNQEDMARKLPRRNLRSQGAPGSNEEEALQQQTIASPQKTGTRLTRAGSMDYTEEIRAPGAALDTKGPSSARVVEGDPEMEVMFPPAAQSLPRGTSSPRKLDLSPTKASTSSKATSVLTKRQKMASLSPAVNFISPTDCFKSEKPTDAARRLWTRYIRANAEAVIPADFKGRISTEIDTPDKTHPDVSKSRYIPRGEACNFCKEDLNFTWDIVSDVLSSADMYRLRNYTEAHWMARVVHPLLGIVRRLKKYKKNKFEKLEVPDMTAVRMQATLCPKGQLTGDLNRKVDGAIGLQLTLEENQILERARYNGDTPSINQVAGEFGNFVPMFLCIEVKRPNTNKDPLIQLGAWAAAEFIKRTIEGYSLDMPTLALAIEGDRWDLYFAYAKQGKEGDLSSCIFVGPTHIGDTDDIEGVFKILHFLCQCADWGLKEYREWFDDQILKRY